MPDWMLGCWKRRSISFADGLSDVQTQVFWLQSRGFTIDLRLPPGCDQLPAKALADYDATERARLADHEGWCADAEWDGRALSWCNTEASLQLHNRWPEPAILQRTGNCMVEHCPSGAYVEDWRLQSSADGPLAGLRLIDERELDGGRVRQRGGGLIVCGDYAALTLGRAGTLAAGQSLKARVAEAGADVARLAALFGCETSVAHGDAASGYSVFLSTWPGRVGQTLFPLDGFEVAAGGVVQRLEIEGRRVERRFEIDTLEAAVAFPQATSWPPHAADWYAREQGTLRRHAEVLR
ncbi:MAG: hypothetical protein QM661_05955 [Solimonas sp.]